MSAGKTYLKCKCPHCGAEVSYPDYAGGGASSCGHGTFLVLPLGGNDDQISAAIAAKSLDMFWVQDRRGFLVSFSGTTVELSNAIGITSMDPEAQSTLGPAMVVVITSYYGLAGTTMWEWMKTRLERGG